MRHFQDYFGAFILSPAAHNKPMEKNGEKRKGQYGPRDGLAPMPSEVENDFGSFRLGPMWLGAESVQFANPAMERAADPAKRGGDAPKDV